jgi:hypothetical protein
MLPCVLCRAVRVVGVRDWRFNQHIEDIEWLLKLQSADGSASTGVCVSVVLHQFLRQWQQQRWRRDPAHLPLTCADDGRDSRGLKSSFTCSRAVCLQQGT